MVKNINNLKKTNRSMKKRILWLEKLAREKPVTTQHENNNETIQEEKNDDTDSCYDWVKDWALRSQNL